MQKKIEDLVAKCRPYTKKGEVASYIPELGKADKEQLAVCVLDKEGNQCQAGDYSQKFTIQSIAKVAIFICCLLDAGKSEVGKKVSFEPTSDGFNSIVNLETKNKHRPLNPFINAGAIACITLIKGADPEDKFVRVREFVRKMSGNSDIEVAEGVYLSEKKTGSRNRALAYFMKSSLIIKDEDIEELLDVYFKICSLSVTVKDLANMGLVLAQNGRTPAGEKLFGAETARTVKATMTLCGMYDESGEFAVNVGLPSKSGVGGGILSVVPGRFGIGVYGPSLNKKGTSVAGKKLLQELSREFDLSIF